MGTQSAPRLHLVGVGGCVSLIGKRKRYVHLMLSGDLQAVAFFVQFIVTETPHAIIHTLGISLVDLQVCINVQNS